MSDSATRATAAPKTPQEWIALLEAERARLAALPVCAGCRHGAGDHDDRGECTAPDTDPGVLCSMGAGRCPCIWYHPERRYDDE